MRNVVLFSSTISINVSITDLAKSLSILAVGSSAKSIGVLLVRASES
ncbi:MAG: hypothetical protein H7647_09595 [Candidatus Heimdallarchaeota archaeon]|nr:hypothetical protein [Candidatus Heimdallarchaeota archaeon]